MQQHFNHRNPRRRRKGVGIENLYEKIMTEKFPDPERGKARQVQESQSVPNKRNPKRPNPRYIIIKMPNCKDKES